MTFRRQLFLVTISALLLPLAFPPFGNIHHHHPRRPPPPRSAGLQPSLRLHAPLRGLLALRHDSRRTRHACYRAMRLIHEHFGQDPATLGEAQFRDYILHVKTPMAEAVSGCPCRMIPKKCAMRGLTPATNDI
jgi:hypothetical protein